ncbi:MAG: pseudouridine synthase, partial [Limisphaerales bacterium]
LGRDEHSRVAIKDCVRPDGTPASTGYDVVRRFTRDVPRGAGQVMAHRQAPGQNFTLLAVVPQTGRKHQIRIHLAHIGHPLVGDKIYGGDEDLYLALVEDRLTLEQRDKLILPHHALHARQVRFSWRDREWEFTAEPEPWFTDFAGE